MSEQAIPIWHVYVRNGKAYVPRVAVVEAGYFLDIEPVSVVDLSDMSLLAAAIEQAIEQGNPRVSTPSRAAFPKPVILKPAGVKRWGDFVQEGACFTILYAGGAFEISETAEADDGEWAESEAPNERIAAESGAAGIARHIVSRVQRRADLQRG